ncbi:methionine ABC transporter ATP-binding protein [Cytobacillus purgationiresistens]|uniref:D-methionine transport system ATP-binding protein n=1 Tax=Cytobacillus purgationiresistens TaxID=863449 RepID=A0ABU0AAA5_9BACI|nr:methionine ABC transporter ATP-binding protein [Cytobacillus purgationiresistens]MDQ0268178.1 D-methionine transport system ATP-binding protein [Cytobacillus purgationiresistens]
MIEFRNVSKVFKTGDKQIDALKDIDITVEKGDIFGVIGFSGAGKSTLIRTVNLLEKPSSGEVLIEGKNYTTIPEKKLREAKRNIGMIFQHFNLLNSKTVYDNVAMPLILAKMKKSDIHTRVKEILQFVGLSDKADNYPNELSGGQKQRVGIARALAPNPSILLCDEATSALDPQTTKSILELLKRVNQEYKITILIITHEMEVIKQVCNRVAVMEDGQLIESGSVFDIFAHPRTVTTRNFVRSVVRDEVPESVINLINLDRESSRIYKVEFFGTDSGQPVVSKTAKRFNVEINVLFGNITELQGIPFGNLIIQVIGAHREVEDAIQYIIEQNVEVKEVEADGSQHRVNDQSFVGNIVHG